MGCCLSKTTSPSSSSPIGGSCSIKSPEQNKSAIDKPLKLETEAQEKIREEESKPKKEVKQEVELEDNGKPRKEVFVIKHRRSHERSSKTTTDPEDSSVSEEKSTGSNHNPVDVDAILIQCGRLSRSNSAAAKTRRYSGSKRSFDFDQNERSRDGGDAEEADAEDGGEEEEAERRILRQRHRGGDSPRERRRRTPSREREDSKTHRSGSRERGSGNGGGGSRRVSRSPGRRSEINPNPNPNSCGSSVNSSNNRPAKFVSVPATDKASSNNGDASVKRITVKRNVGKAASPRSQSPARAASQPSPSKLSRKTDHSPYRRNPLGEIDPNSVAFPLPQGDKLGSGNTNCNKRMMNKDNESQGLVKESGNFIAQKLNPGPNTKTTTQGPIRRSASPSRAIKEQQEAVEECKIASGTDFAKPQIMSRCRSLRKSRDFDFSPETLLSNNIDNKNNNAPAQAPALTSYTALLLEDIQNFHQKSVNVNAMNSSSMSKACFIVEAVADLNSTTNQHQRTELSFTSAAGKKADLMEPSFEKYVTVKRGCSSLEDMEEQESSGSNSITGSSCVVQRPGSSWEPNSAESTDRVSRSSNKQERDRSPFGVNFERQEFDPLKKNGVGVGRRRVTVVDSSSSGKGVLQATTTTRVAAVSMQQK